MQVIVLCSRRTANPAATYFPVTLRPIVVNALNAKYFMVFDQPRDDVLLDTFAGWCGRVAVVTAVAEVLSCAESVRAPCGAAADRSASVTAKVPESPALFEVLADLAQVR